MLWLVPFSYPHLSLSLSTLNAVLQIPEVVHSEYPTGARDLIATISILHHNASSIKEVLLLMPDDIQESVTHRLFVEDMDIILSELTRLAPTAKILDNSKSEITRFSLETVKDILTLTRSTGPRRWAVRFRWSLPFSKLLMSGSNTTHPLEEMVVRVQALIVQRLLVLLRQVPCLLEFGSVDVEDYLINFATFVQKLNAPAILHGNPDLLLSHFRNGTRELKSYYPFESLSHEQAYRFLIGDARSFFVDASDALKRQAYEYYTLGIKLKNI